MKVGDRIVIEPKKALQSGRSGVIEEVLQESPARVSVRWDDGRSSILSPAAGVARITSARAAKARERAAAAKAAAGESAPASAAPKAKGAAAKSASKGAAAKSAAPKAKAKPKK
jgi:hypothetical protein